MREPAPPPQPPIRPGMAHQNMPDVQAPLISRALSQFKIEVAEDIGLPPSQHPGRHMGHMAGSLGGPIDMDIARRISEGTGK